jgi:hypothetical protein
LLRKREAVSLVCNRHQRPNRLTERTRTLAHNQVLEAPTRPDHLVMQAGIRRHLSSI